MKIKPIAVMNGVEVFCEDLRFWNLSGSEFSLLCYRIRDRSPSDAHVRFQLKFSNGDYCGVFQVHSFSGHIEFEAHAATVLHLIQSLSRRFELVQRQWQDAKSSSEATSGQARAS